MQMQDRYVAGRAVRVIRVMSPSICSECCRMTSKVKDLNDTFPHRFALKCLFHRHAFNVCSVRASHRANHVSKTVEISHNAASILILLIKPPQGTAGLPQRRPRAGLSLPAFASGET